MGLDVDLQRLQSEVFVSRLTTPDDQVGADYDVGVQNARYLCPTIEHVDRHISALTGRMRTWIEAGKFPDLVETLTADRDLLLERRVYLMAMAVQAS